LPTNDLEQSVVVPGEEFKLPPIANNK